MVTGQPLLNIPHDADRYTSTTFTCPAAIDFKHQAFVDAPEREKGIIASIRYLENKGHCMMDYHDAFCYEGIEFHFGKS